MGPTDPFQHPVRYELNVHDQIMQKFFEFQYFRYQISFTIILVFISFF